MWLFKPNYEKHIPELARQRNRDGLTSLMLKMSLPDLIRAIEIFGELYYIVADVATDAIAVVGLKGLPSLLPLVSHRNSEVRLAAVTGIRKVVSLAFMNDLAARFPEVAKALAEFGAFGMGAHDLELFSTVRNVLPGKEHVSVKLILTALLGQNAFDEVTTVFRTASGDSDKRIQEIAKKTMEVMKA